MIPQLLPGWWTFGPPNPPLLATTYLEYTAPDRKPDFTADRRIPDFTSESRKLDYAAPLHR